MYTINTIIRVRETDSVDKYTDKVDNSAAGCCRFSFLSAAIKQRTTQRGKCSKWRRTLCCRMTPGIDCVTVRWWWTTANMSQPLLQCSVRAPVWSIHGADLPESVAFRDNRAAQSNLPLQVKMSLDDKHTQSSGGNSHVGCVFIFFESLFLLSSLIAAAL